MMACSSRPVTGGVDTHKDTHVAAVVDHLGGALGTAAFANTAAGHAALLAWFRDHGEIDQVGVEGTGSYGAGLSRFLRAAGVKVIEVNRPNRQARRAAGKADDLDALEAARAARAGRATGLPKAGDGIVEAIRVLRLARRSALQARVQCGNQLQALVDTAPEPWRSQVHGMTVTRLVALAPTWPTHGDLADPCATNPWTGQLLAARWTMLDDQITALDGHLDRLVRQAAPSLIAQFGVGPHTASALLVAAGDNPHRLHSEAAFAALCGVAPLPATSGRITYRHRLNRGGNRAANHALWRIALVRMAHDPATRAYVARRTADGKSKRDIIRILKRYIARELYPHVLHHAGPSPTT